MKKIIVTNKSGKKLHIIFADEVFQFYLPMPGADEQNKILTRIAQKLADTHMDNGSVYIRHISPDAGKLSLYQSATIDHRDAFQVCVLDEKNPENYACTLDKNYDTSDADRDVMNNITAQLNKECLPKHVQIKVKPVTPDIQPLQIGDYLSSLQHLRNRAALQISDEHLHVAALSLFDHNAHLHAVKNQSLDADKAAANKACRDYSRDDTLNRSSNEILAQYTSNAARKLCEKIDGEYKTVDKMIAQSIVNQKDDTESLSKPLSNYLIAKHELHGFRENLAAAIYNSASELFQKIQASNASSVKIVESSTRDRDTFNFIFQGLVTIKPDFTLSSYDNIVFQLKKLAPEQLEDVLSKLLNAAYTECGDKKDLTAIDSLLGRLAAANDEAQTKSGKYFSPQARLYRHDARKHKFTLNQNTRDLFSRYNSYRTESLKIEGKNVSAVVEIYNLITDSIAGFSRDNSKATMPGYQKLVSENISAFKKFLHDREQLLAEIFDLSTRAERVNPANTLADNIDNSSLPEPAKEDLKQGLNARLEAITEISDQIIHELGAVNKDLTDLTQALVDSNSLDRLNYEEQIKDIRARLAFISKDSFDALDASLRTASQQEELCKTQINYFNALKQAEGNLTDYLTDLGRAADNLPLGDAIDEAHQRIVSANQRLNAEVNLNGNQLLNHEKSAIALNIQIQDRNIAAILKCQMLMSILLNTEYWRQHARNEKTIAVTINNDRSASIPQPVYDLMQLAANNEYANWHSDPVAADRLLAAMAESAAGNNHHAQVAKLLSVINDRDLTINHTQGIYAELNRDFAGMIPPNQRLINPANAPAIQPRGTFAERYPVFSKVLTYGLIGLVGGAMVIPALALTSPVAVPVLIIGGIAAAVGFGIGALVGAIKGYRDKKRAQAAANVPAEARPLLADEYRPDNNPFGPKPEAQERPAPPAYSPKEPLVGSNNPFDTDVPALLPAATQVSTNPFAMFPTPNNHILSDERIHFESDFVLALAKEASSSDKSLLNDLEFKFSEVFRDSGYNINAFIRYMNEEYPRTAVRHIQKALLNTAVKHPTLDAAQFADTELMDPKYKLATILAMARKNAASTLNMKK